ncbi:MAG: GTP cyclohydrolase I FolE [Candidatus Dormibacteria bacterium]
MTDTQDPGAGARTEIAAAIRALLPELDPEPDRDGLAGTPARAAASLAYLTSGYRTTPADIVRGAIFEESYDEMVVVRDIELYSLCEHHLLPFIGKAHVAYLPRGRIVGLSKIPRIVDAYAHRLQVQERLTVQIAEAIEEVLQPLGVAVVIEAAHLCMMMRGIQKQNSQTVTSSLLGGFRSNEKSRGEFLRLIGRG